MLVLTMLESMDSFAILTYPHGHSLPMMMMSLSLTTHTHIHTYTHTHIHTQTLPPNDDDVTFTHHTHTHTHIRTLLPMMSPHLVCSILQITMATEDAVCNIWAVARYGIVKDSVPAHIPGSDVSLLLKEERNHGNRSPQAGNVEWRLLTRCGRVHTTPPLCDQEFNHRLSLVVHGHV